MRGLLADAVSSLLFVQSTNYGMQFVESGIGRCLTCYKSLLAVVMLGHTY